MDEIWKPIKGYEELYEISNLGRAKGLIHYDVQNGYKEKEHILKPFSQGKYKVICLRKNKRRKNFYIHRLVAETFIENPNNYKVVNHIDYDPSNNNVSNLEWCTQKMNVNWSRHNMSKPRNVIHSNTGYKYISYRKEKDIYRIEVKPKERSAKTLEEAIRIRDEMLNEKKKYSN